MVSAPALMGLGLHPLAYVTSSMRTCTCTMHMHTHVRAAHLVVREVFHARADVGVRDPLHTREQIVDRIEHTCGAARIGVELPRDEVRIALGLPKATGQRAAQRRDHVVQEAQRLSLVPLVRVRVKVRVRVSSARIMLCRKPNGLASSLCDEARTRACTRTHFHAS